MPRRPTPKRLALCAALPLAILALWLFSGWRLLSWRSGFGNQRFSVVAAMGIINFQYWHDTARVPGESLFPGALSLTHYIEEGPTPAWSWWPRHIIQGIPSGAAMSIPLWLPFLAAAAASAGLTFRRRAPGTCAKCGYDLSGAAAGVCPECGSGSAAHNSR